MFTRLRYFFIGKKNFISNFVIRVSFSIGQNIFYVDFAKEDL